MSGASRSIRTVSAGARPLLIGALNASGQVTIDVHNRYPDVGALMVWRVDEMTKPTQLVGFASGTLIHNRVMVMAGRFTTQTSIWIFHERAKRR